MSFFHKQPAEQYTIAVEFSGKLPSGTALSSGTVAAVDSQGNDVATTILGSTGAAISGTQAKVLVKAGTTGQQYKITFKMTLDNANLLEEDITMSVVDR